MAKRTKVTGLKELQGLMNRFGNAFQSLAEGEGKPQTLVENSDFVNADNKVNENVLSPTDKAARHEARYRAARLHQGFDERQTDESELAEVSDEIANRYIRDYLNKLFSDIE